MAKRPSILDNLDLSPKTPAPQEVPATAEIVDLKAVSKKAKAADIQHTSVYIPRAAYDRLREIAFHERKKIHDLLMEGADSVIAARGHSESATRKTKTS